MNKDNYRCSNCGKTNVRLWREYQTFDPKIICTECLPKEKDRKKILNDEKKYTNPYTNTGWWVAAVPSGDGHWWGYTSIPEEQLNWWRGLPIGLDE